jgi:hypothetical protein
VGPIEAAVQRLVDRSAAVVIALNHHPDRITRIDAWEDIVHARGLQATGPLGEASAPPIFRLPLALLHKIGESLKKLQLLDGTAGEVLGAFKKVETLVTTLTARLLSEVNEDRGEMAAARKLLDEIGGIVDYATSLMSWPLGFTTMDLSCDYVTSLMSCPLGDVQHEACVSLVMLINDEHNDTVREGWSAILNARIGTLRRRQQVADLSSWLARAPAASGFGLFGFRVDPELDQRAAEAERKATSEKQRILRKRQLKAAKRMSRQQARGPRYGLPQRGRESCRH